MKRMISSAAIEAPVVSGVDFDVVFSVMISRALGIQFILSKSLTDIFACLRFLEAKLTNVLDSLKSFR